MAQHPPERESGGHARAAFLPNGGDGSPSTGAMGGPRIGARGPLPAPPSASSASSTVASASQPSASPSSSSSSSAAAAAAAAVPQSSDTTGGPPTAQKPVAHGLSRWSPQRPAGAEAASSGWGASGGGAAAPRPRPPVPMRSATISHALPRDHHASLPVIISSPSSSRHAPPPSGVPVARPLPTASTPAAAVQENAAERDQTPKVPPRTRPQASRSPAPPALATLQSSVSPVTTSTTTTSAAVNSITSTEDDASAVSHQPKRVPPPRPSRITVTAGRIDGWLREQPSMQHAPPHQPPPKVPPIPAKPIEERGRETNGRSSPTSPHRRSPSSGSTPGLLARVNSPLSPSPSFSPPPSSFSYVAAPLKTSSPRGDQQQEESPSPYAPDSKDDSGGTLRERKGSFSTNLFNNLNFWKKSSSPSSARSEVIRRGESNRFLDALNKSKEDSDLPETESPNSSSSPTSSSKRDDHGSIRAIHGFLFNRDEKRRELHDKKSFREKEGADRENTTSKDMATSEVENAASRAEASSVSLSAAGETRCSQPIISAEGKPSKVTVKSPADSALPISAKTTSAGAPRMLKSGRSVSWTNCRGLSDPSLVSSSTSTNEQTGTRHPSKGRSRSAILPRSSSSLLVSSSQATSSRSSSSAASISPVQSQGSGRVSGELSASTVVSPAVDSFKQPAQQAGPVPINHIFAANKYLCQRWAQGKCKPGRAPRIKKLKSSERKRLVVLALDANGILVLDPHSNEVVLSHLFTQIKNWGHREGTTGMHFNYIATGNKYPEIFDFKSDQALEIFERLSFLHALKPKNNKSGIRVTTEEIMIKPSSDMSPHERSGSSVMTPIVYETTNTVTRQERNTAERDRLSSEQTAAGDVDSEGTLNGDTRRGRAGGVRRLDKIRWSVMMEESVELIEGDGDNRGKENMDEGQEKTTLLSPRSVMARLEKKKSWQDITKNIKKFDFQSEKAKEIREERERREKEREKEKKKDRSDDSASLLKAAKKSFRVKTLRKEEVEIVRRLVPGEEAEQEERSSTFSRGVSFELLVTESTTIHQDSRRSSSPLLSEKEIEQENGENGMSTGTRNSGEVDPSSSTSGSERKKVDQREELVKELIKTEKKYVRDLNTIVEQYMKRLRDNGMVEAADIATIFSNVDQIKVLNGTLLDSLSGLDELPTENSNVGERFLSFIGYLRLYTQYCSNQTLAGNRLKELKESKSELNQLLEEMRDLPDVNRLDLESFLIKPMQRLTRYPLFFQQLLKLTPDTHPDYANLAKCLEGLHEVVTTINNQKQRNDNLNKLLLLQRQFADTKEQPALKLVEASRKFVREGVFPKIIYGNVSVKNCTVILFNDILVLAVKKDKGTTVIYTPKSPKIPLTGLLVWDEKSVPFGFSVVGREAGQDKITFQANSEEEKAVWVDDISLAIAHMPSVLRGHRRTPSAVEKFVRHNEPPAAPLG